LAVLLAHKQRFRVCDRTHHVTVRVPRREPPMARRATASVVAVLAVGCASGHAKVDAHPAPTHASPSAVTPSNTAADARLSRLLIRADDLPVGYIKDKQARGASLAVSPTDSVCARHFAEVTRLSTVGVLAPVARARASFTKKDGQSFLRVAAFRYRNSQAAARVVSAVDGVLAGCRKFTATNPNSKRVVDVALSPLPFPHLGQGGVATDGTLTSAAQHVYVDMVFVRTASSIAYVTGLTTGQRDFTALKRAARAEVKRLGTG
jgi:hypothetical protein